MQKACWLILFQILQSQQRWNCKQEYILQCHIKKWGSIFTKIVHIQLVITFFLVFSSHYVSPFFPCGLSCFCLYSTWTYLIQMLCWKYIYVLKGDLFSGLHFCNCMNKSLYSFISKAWMIWFLRYQGLHYYEFILKCLWECEWQILSHAKIHDWIHSPPRPQAPGQKAPPRGCPSICLSSREPLTQSANHRAWL